MEICCYEVVGDVGFAFLFFQAEDGIRDLVRSRGLGDVYKRQVIIKGSLTVNGKGAKGLIRVEENGNEVGSTSSDELGAVSYTHLTLPTSDLV